jgi:hypothetical protein
MLLGAIGGALGRVLLGPGFEAGPAFGAGYALLFAVLAAPRARTPGAGLIWGLGFAFVLWVAVPVGILAVAAGGGNAMGSLDLARARFPNLVAYVLLFGAPLGTALGAMGIRHRDPGLELAGRTSSHTCRPEGPVARKPTLVGYGAAAAGA